MKKTMYNANKKSFIPKHSIYKKITLQSVSYFNIVLSKEV